MTRPTYTKDFIKLIDSFRYRFDPRELFRDWTELMSAELHQKPYHDFDWQTDPVFDRVEADYLAAAKRYERKDFDIFAEMIGITNEALREEKQDFLGHCFMELGVASKGWGQEFTPYEMSYLVARMTLADDVAATIDRVGFVTIHEPACGAGGMLIAAAQVLEEESHRDPTSSLWFSAIDIDRMCANMTYIQCSLLGLSGIVYQGDTLRMDMRSWRITPAAAVNYERTKRMFDYASGRWEPTPPLPATGLLQVQLLTV